MTALRASVENYSGDYLLESGKVCTMCMYMCCYIEQHGPVMVAASPVVLLAGLCLPGLLLHPVGQTKLAAARQEPCESPSQDPHLPSLIAAWLYRPQKQDHAP